VEFPGDPVNVALANSWIVINSGGGPTDDKPTVILETPRDPDRVSSFLNIRVKDIDAVYAEWSARGAEFLTPPADRSGADRWLADAELGQARRPSRPAAFPAAGGVRPGGLVEVAVPGPRQRPGQPPPAEPG
jgi:hypothetical protein